MVAVVRGGGEPVWSRQLEGKYITHGEALAPGGVLHADPQHLGRHQSEGEVHGDGLWRCCPVTRSGAMP